MSLAFSQSNVLKWYYLHLIFSLSKKFQALNLILLTSSELSEIRDLLKQSLVNPAGKDLYVSLYASWCHSPMAIISLCLLSQVGIYNFILITTAKLFPTRLGRLGFDYWFDFKSLLHMCT